jgi:hypothetical protein
LAIVLAGILAIPAFSQTVPTQPQDPTAQSPASPSPASPGTPPTFPAPKAQSPDMGSGNSAPTSTTTPVHKGKTKQFSGTIMKQADGYVLKVGNLAYRLDDQDKAQQYSDRTVKVMGTLDKATNTIHMEAIEPTSSM